MLHPGCILVSSGRTAPRERKGKDMEALTLTVTVYVRTDDNFEPEALEEVVTEWVADRLGTPDIIDVAGADYEVTKVQVEA